ncbi:MAG TPA: hypothetical protein VFI00_05715, partial [Kribbella sp.]|nr:hypothetical protein [Kribbella sp.]
MREPLSVHTPADNPNGVLLAFSTASAGVRKTYKLYIGGSFPRRESGRTYPVTSARDGEFLANAALASRKDVRDAVR